MKLIDLIKDKKAVFVEFHSGNLFYEIDVWSDYDSHGVRSKSKFRFPVPVDELHGASVGASEKASVFMKWIKHTHNDINQAVKK